MKKAIIYDFDKTVYNGETSINFILFFLSKHPHLILKFIFNLFLILFNIASLEKTKNIFFSILNNIDDNVLDSDISLFWEKERNKIFPYFYNEIKKNKKEGYFLYLLFWEIIIYISVLVAQFIKICSITNTAII